MNRFLYPRMAACSRPAFSLTMPAEIFTSRSDGSGAEQISHHNAARLATLDMNSPESFWFEGAGGTRVQGMLIRPRISTRRKNILYYC